MKHSTTKGTAFATLQDLDKSLFDRQHAELALEEINVKIEQACAAIRARYAERVTELATIIVTETKLEMDYLIEHKSDFDGPPRSLTLSSGTVGFRLGQERLAQGVHGLVGRVVGHPEAGGGLFDRDLAHEKIQKPQPLAPTQPADAQKTAGSLLEGVAAPAAGVPVGMVCHP